MRLADSKAEIAEPAPAVDIEKKIKALKKKLRDIEELSKKDQSQLNPEQLEKLSKKSSLEQEIKALEDCKSS